MHCKQTTRPVHNLPLCGFNKLHDINKLCSAVGKLQSLCGFSAMSCPLHVAHWNLTHCYNKVIDWRPEIVAAIDGMKRRHSNQQQLFCTAGSGPFLNTTCIAFDKCWVPCYHICNPSAHGATDCDKKLTLRIESCCRVLIGTGGQLEHKYIQARLHLSAPIHSIFIVPASSAATAGQTSR